MSIAFLSEILLIGTPLSNCKLAMLLRKETGKKAIKLLISTYLTGKEIGV